MIPALVLQKNNTLYFGPGVTAEKSGSGEIVVGLGLSSEIPIPGSVEGGQIDADYWAVPVSEGYAGGFNYVPYNPSDPVGSVAPDPQAFKVFRIYNLLRSDYWYVVGTVAGYVTAAGGGAALPTTVSTLQAGCQTLCEFDENNKYFAIFALPTLSGNKHYFPYGYFNGVALPAANAAGYANKTDLLTFLNTAVTGWAAVGTWTVSTDNLTLRVEQTSGPGTDKICAQVAAINPSL